MAIGATAKRIYRLTFSQVAVPVVAGLSAGLIAIVLISDVLGKLLYEMKGIDTSVVLTVIFVFLGSAGAAGYLPARHAAAVDPMESLRSD